MMAKDKSRDEPVFHGGTLGDRFADAGHAARPTPANLQGPPKNRRKGCSLFGVVTLAILAMVVTPAALAAGMGLMWVGLAASMVTAYGMVAR